MADKRYFRNEDVDIHIIITNKDAKVTGVVDDVPTISNAKYIITDEDLIEEEFTIKESLCSQQRPIIGSCESNGLEFQMQIKDADGIELTTPNRNDWITVYMWFDEDSSNIMTIGTYRVNTANVKVDENKTTIKAYDVMLDLRNTDVADWFYDFWSINELATIKNFTDTLLEHLGLERHGSLPNQSVLIEKFIEGEDVISAGYLLSLIAEANGCFGHITRDNKFGFIRISAAQTNAVTITEDTRFNPTKRSKYEYTWAPTGVKLLDAKGNKLGGYRATKEKPYIIKNNPLLESVAEDDRKGALKNIYKAMELWGYAPAKVKSIGDLMVEVGDRIRVNEEADDDESEDGFFKTFVLEREYKGIYLPFDTYTAKGERDLTQTDATSVTNNFSGGSLENNSSPNPTKQNYTILGSGLAYEDLPEIIRNFGLRLLDEPSNVNVLAANNSVALTWNDPTDITDECPCPVEWAGTVVVRKLGKAPINRWDGELVVDSIIRNEYASNSLIDNVSVDSDYYYGIFPYDTEGHYRYTKSVGINTDYKGDYPTIDSIEADDSSNVTVGFTLPSGNWQSIKLCYKKDSIPDITDSSVDLSVGDTSKSVKLTEDGTYYFIIYMIDSNNRVIESNERSIDFVKPPIVAGLYDASGSLIAKWNDAGINADGSNAYTIINNSYPNTYKVISPKTAYRLNLNATAIVQLEMEDFEVPSGQESFIPDGMCEYCRSLERVKLPSNITAIGGRAFRGNSSLKQINSTGITNIAEFVIPEGVVSIGADAFNGAGALGGNLVAYTRMQLPSTLTTIYQYAFYGCYFAIDELPSNLKIIYEYAFRGCHTFNTRFVIPSTVFRIKEYAFLYFAGYDSSSASFELILNEGLKTIDQYAFKDSIWQYYAEIKLPRTCDYIGTDAFVNFKKLLVPQTSVISGAKIPWGAKAYEYY